MTTTSSWRERASWCLFDFANSAFVTIMITAFYSRYFVEVVARDTHNPNTLWGAAIGLSMLVVAVSSPFLGAIADRAGNKRTMLRLYVAVNVVTCAALGFVTPNHVWAIPLSLALIVTANIAFEGSYVFYNAFLNELVPQERVGRLSGYGWALGYMGGLGCLVLVKYAGWIPRSYEGEVSLSALHIPVAVALWFAVFSLPMMLLVKDRTPVSRQPAGTDTYVKIALTELKHSYAVLRRHPDLRRFLFSYLLFTNAPTTVIIFTGSFTGDALHFSPAETIQLFLILNIIAAPGALGFGFVVDRVGGVIGVGLSLALWVVVIVASIFVQTKTQFWFIALVAAIGLGATQSASRSVLAKMAPKGHANQLFGLMTVAGKSSAIAGPITYGLVRDLSGSPRAAVGSMLVFLLAGFALLFKVDEKRALRAVQ